MQGTIVKVTVAEGDSVDEGDTIVVLEAMKMEQPLKAHKAGTVSGLKAEVGAGVTNGEVICEIKDAECPPDRAQGRREGTSGCPGNSTLRRVVANPYPLLRVGWRVNAGSEAVVVTVCLLIY